MDIKNDNSKQQIEDKLDPGRAMNLTFPFYSLVPENFTSGACKRHVSKKTGTLDRNTCPRAVQIEGGLANILDYVPKDVTLLPNTSGARNAQEAVRIARLSRELGCGDFVKIEVIHDSKYLLPDNYETIKATEILAKEGFVVMPYMYPDLNAARDLVNVGAACVMPLGSPIGSNKGICTKEFIQILIDEIDLPIIVDAGIGRPSQACEAMEMGAAAVMANTAVATAGDVEIMAEAFKKAIEAGRMAYLSGLGRTLTKGASASSPLTGYLRD